jgi:broad specificity phosphatase PhoE
MLRRTPLTFLLLTLFATGASAQTQIFLVRHAERADAGATMSPSMSADPDLSPAGRARAKALADVLKDVPLAAIFATEYKRTQQTAKPTADAHHVALTTVNSKDTPALLAKLKAATGPVLVVAHSNTIPDIVKALGVTTPVVVEEAEFDRLFIVTTGATPTVVTLHYR